MKIFTFLLFLSIPLICCSQKKEYKKGAYSAYLYSVDGGSNFSLDSTKSMYEDSLIKITWQFAYSQMTFDLLNKSDKTIRIIWDDAALIDLTNKSERVFHAGVKYTDRDKPQAPTSVYKKTGLSDLVAPIAYARFQSGQYGGWRSDPLIPVSGWAMSSKVEYVPALIGQTMRVVLPIKVDEKLSEYIFSFRTEFVEKKKK